MLEMPPFATKDAILLHNGLGRCMGTEVMISIRTCNVVRFPPVWGGLSAWIRCPCFQSRKQRSLYPVHCEPRSYTVRCPSRPKVCSRARKLGWHLFSSCPNTIRCTGVVGIKLNTVQPMSWVDAENVLSAQAQGVLRNERNIVAVVTYFF